MNNHEQQHGIPLEKALQAQKAMREAAGLPEESFPLEAFVGMVSDEIDALRRSGRSDEDIAGLIGKSSGITISPRQIREHYAGPELRHPPQK